MKISFTLNHRPVTLDTDPRRRLLDVLREDFLLTGTKANVYAYYPYDVANTNITAIPIDVTQNKDVMWADYASNINNANPTATLPMNHALSVIRFSL